MSAPRSKPSLSTPAVEAEPAAVTGRILRQARAHLMAHGYCQCTMDELAAELGMSKKTLYVHFPSKDALIAAVLEQFGTEVRAESDALLARTDLDFAGKIHGFAAAMMRRLGAVPPLLFRDLQRHAPALYQRLADIREKNIPYVFGRFLEEGQQTGMVRPELDRAFAVQFLLAAINGLLQASSTGRLALAPHEVLPRALDLFFGGLLTPAGRKAYEKQHAR